MSGEMTQREKVSGWQIWEDQSGRYYARLEAVAAVLAMSSPNTAANLLQWILSQDES